MEVHPAGSPLSSQDSGRPGESCGCGLVAELAFYDITNHFLLRTFAIENSKKRSSLSLECIVELHQGGVHLMVTPGMEHQEV